MAEQPAAAPRSVPRRPAFAGWYRTAGGGWQRLAEGADYGEAWGQLLDRLPGGKGGESVVLPVGVHPGEARRAQRRKGAGR
jgi:hypothetical protein